MSLDERMFFLFYHLEGQEELSVDAVDDRAVREENRMWRAVFQKKCGCRRCPD